MAPLVTFLLVRVCVLRLASHPASLDFPGKFGNVTRSLVAESGHVNYELFLVCALSNARAGPHWGGVRQGGGSRSE